LLKNTFFKQFNNFLVFVVLQKKVGLFKGI